jgi:hypothetical protein
MSRLSCLRVKYILHDITQMKLDNASVSLPDARVFAQEPASGQLLAEVGSALLRRLFAFLAGEDTAAVVVFERDEPAF